MNFFSDRLKRAPAPVRTNNIFGATAACILFGLHCTSSAGVNVQLTDSTTITYLGETSEVGVQSLLDAIGSAAPRVLKIRSEGGDLAAAIKIARIVEERAMVVRVEGYCLSSCANYIFASGSSKELPEGAILGMHGGPTSEILTRLENSLDGKGGLRDAMAAAMRPAIDLYRLLGISDSLIACSGRVAATPQRIDIKGRTATFSGASDKIIFLPTLKQLKEVGMSGIHIFHQPRNLPEAKRAIRRLGLVGITPVFSSCEEFK